MGSEAHTLFKALVFLSCWRIQGSHGHLASLGIRGFILGQVGFWLEGPEVSRACSKLWCPCVDTFAKESGVLK